MLCSYKSSVHVHGRQLLVIFDDFIILLIFSIFRPATSTSSLTVLSVYVSALFCVAVSFFNLATKDRLIEFSRIVYIVVPIISDLQPPGPAVFIIM